MNLERLKIISAGAGSGKTYRLTQEMVGLLSSGQVRPNGIIATTFTRKAAAELQERVRVKLLSSGLTEQADELTNALIGTVHGLGVKLLRRFAFEAGVSPQADILPEGEQQHMFNQALAATLKLELIEEMDELSDRLGLTKRSSFFDWRQEVRRLVDIARANDFSLDDLHNSSQQSWESFAAFLPDEKTITSEQLHQDLKTQISTTIEELEAGEDQTKKTSTVIDRLRTFRREMQLRGYLYWHQWATVGKLDTGAKSRDVIAPLKEFAWQHQALPGFRSDIKSFIQNLFHTAIAALQEYDDYKKRRGLIDYTDMEVLVSKLLDNPAVKAVLQDELDLLMVDEFQDTNPIQLAIFLKLSQLAKHSVWVGDPKQSIYGFRGAEPRLMQAIIEAAGGIKADNIQIQSWRSRADLVYMVNSLFCRAFPELPQEQVALDPVRVPEGNEFSAAEPETMEEGIIHWHFQPDEGRRAPAKPWMEESIAHSLKEWLAAKVYIMPKGEATARPAKPGDVAILCRSNRDCATMAQSLQRAGLKAAIATAGLLATAEIRLVLACLKYILNQEDSLSAAEILVLAARLSVEEVIEDRLGYLEEYDDTPSYKRPAWAVEHDFVNDLDRLRPTLDETSGAETLNQVLEELDLRRCIVAWGKSEQRLSNIDQLRRLALEYEANCNNTQSAASLSGFLLWLSQLAASEQDMQGAAEDPQAVNVLTYHRSKGLEWPVVICHNLEQKLRADLWGIDLVPEREEVDLNEVLKGRWLRYWVNPYADQGGKTPLAEQMATSPAQERKTAHALAEEARLLYVGLTRARDYLIFPTQEGRPTKWLNRCWSQGDESIPTLDANTSDSPWEWNGRFLNKHTRTYTYPRQFTVAEAQHSSTPFLAKVSGTEQHPDAKLSGPEILQGKTLEKGKSVQYYNYQIPEEIDSEKLYRVEVDFLRALFHNSPQDYGRAMATAMCVRYAVPEETLNDLLISQGQAWRRWLQQELPNAKGQTLVPFYWPKSQQYFATTVDWVLQDGEQTVFIQNSSYSGSAPKRQAVQVGADLLAAGEAWRASGRANVSAYWVHFPLLGKLIEVRFTTGQKKKPQIIQGDLFAQ
ncbi:MAG: UvrD-helicase domain-containing protein [Bacteroidota bacterium]